MNRNRARAIYRGCCAPLVALALLVSLTNAAGAAMVYDSLSGTLYSGGWGIGLQGGQQVTLGGTDRAITQVELLLSTPYQEPFTLRFYELDGPGGEPGTMIWESPVQTFPVAAGYYINLIVPISVPNIAVPNTFMWSVAAAVDPNLATLIKRNADLPTIGSNGPLWHQDSLTGDWVSVSPIGFGHGARITAVPVPEPSTFALILAGASAVFVARIRRRTNHR